MRLRLALAALLLAAPATLACAASSPPARDEASRTEVSTPLVRSVDCPEVPAGAVADGSPAERCPGRELAACGQRAREACKAGDLDACFHFAALYEHGSMYIAGDILHIELSPDPACARRLYEELCQRDHFPSCSNLALSLVTHPSPPEHRPRALALLERACAGGYALACSNLGMEYEGSPGVPRDEARAAALYQQACDAGEDIGCKNLARLRGKDAGAPR